MLSDWLIKDGKAQGEITPWLNVISRETYGWPQHILAYMKPAVKHLRRNSGAMTAEGLGKVLTEGRKRRDAYYERRTEGLDGDVCGILADILAPLSRGQSIYKRDIITPLAEEYGQERAEQIFDLALGNGILYERKNAYRSPIPSLINWLLKNFGRNRG